MPGRKKYKATGTWRTERTFLGKNKNKNKNRTTSSGSQTRDKVRFFRARVSWRVKQARTMSLKTEIYLDLRFRFMVTSFKNT